MNKNPNLIGISGKIGSGKNYLANHLNQELTRRGYQVKEGSFATPLKNELTEIIEKVKNNYSINKISKEYNISYYQTNKLVNFFKEEIKHDDNINGYSKTQGTRNSLQYLGTEIRRKQNEDYWVNKMGETISECDIFLIPDTRFWNEADFSRKNNGLNFRLEVPREIILSRAQARDKIRYSAVSEDHISETALDDYPYFDLKIGETFNEKELVDFIENHPKFRK